ncbi:MAG: hypothetical protein LUP94_02125 [Candidatus Methanomethylicus sp.]|nr:hypothetical protein [Candidatus Methanomethylicus sp.]
MATHKGIGACGALMVALLLFLVLGSTAVPCVRATPDEAALRAAVQSTFAQVLSAEQDGANVTNAAAKLNTALGLIENAATESGTVRDEMLASAESILAEVSASIPALKSEGEQALFWGNVTLLSEIALTAMGLIFAYILVPLIYWRLWLRSKRDWKLQAK